MIKAVTLDLWNTLLEDKHFTARRLRVTEEILRGHGHSFSPEEVREASRSAARAYRKMWEEDHRHMAIDRRIRHMLRELDVEPEAGLVGEMIARYEGCFLEDPPILKEGVEETLNGLRGRFLLGIISDTGVTPGSVIREHLSRVGLLDRFSSTVFSDETGYAKPHPVQFQRALEELGVQPHEAIHVGDLIRTDIAGAKAAGMKTVWVQTEGKTAPDNDQPDYTVFRLDQVLSIPELDTP